MQVVERGKGDVNRRKFSCLISRPYFHPARAKPPQFSIPHKFHLYERIPLSHTQSEYSLSDSSIYARNSSPAINMPHSTLETLQTKTINGRPVPLAPLDTIDYGLILSDDSTEKLRLQKACQYPGFFYLDFRNCDEGKEILGELKEAYDIEEEYFTKHHTPPEKMKDIEVRTLCTS